MSFQSLPLKDALLFRIIYIHGLRGQKCVFTRTAVFIYIENSNINGKQKQVGLKNFSSQ